MARRSAAAEAAACPGAKISPRAEPVCAATTPSAPDARRWRASAPATAPPRRCTVAPGRLRRERRQRREVAARRRLRPGGREVGDVGESRGRRGSVRRPGPRKPPTTSQPGQRRQARQGAALARRPEQPRRIRDASADRWRPRGRGRAAQVAGPRQRPAGGRGVDRGRGQQRRGRGAGAAAGGMSARSTSRPRGGRRVTARQSAAACPAERTRSPPAQWSPKRPGQQPRGHPQRRRGQRHQRKRPVGAEPPLEQLAEMSGDLCRRQLPCDPHFRRACIAAAARARPTDAFRPGVERVVASIRNLLAVHRGKLGRQPRSRGREEFARANLAEDFYHLARS